MRPAGLLLSLLLTLSLFAANNPLDTQLPEWWREAEAKATDPELDVDYEALFESPGGPPFAREKLIREALLAVALHPEDRRAAALVVSYCALPRSGNYPYTYDPEEDRRPARAFLHALFSRNAGVGNAAALRWQAGYVQLMLAGGNVEDALPLARQLVAADPSPFNQMLHGAVEKLNGNPEPLAKLAQTGDADLIAETLKELAVSVGKLPAGPAADALSDLRGGVIAPRHHRSWPQRIEGAQLMKSSDPARAVKELREILASPDAPRWAKNDAIYALGRSRELALPADERIALIDCWFMRRKFEFPPLPANAWEELPALLGKPVPDGSDGSCMDFPDEREKPFHIACVELALYERARAAARSRDEAGLKESVEEAVAVSFHRGGPVFMLREILTAAADYFPPESDAYRYIVALPNDSILGWPQRVPARPWEGPTPREPWKSLGISNSRATASCIDQ